MSQYDTNGLFEFLSHTPEHGLRKMLVDGKPFTEVHLSLLLKIVRSGAVSQFAEHFEKKDFPKIKFSPTEQKLKDKFWDDCVNACKAKGILQPGTAQKSAA